MPRLLRRRCASGACAVLLASMVALPGLAQTFVESFSTTTYRDAGATTAWWDTATGKLRLHPWPAPIVGSLDTPDAALDVAVDGDFAYVADRNGGLRVIDIRDPAAPVAHASAVPSGSTWGVVVDGDWGFLTVGNTVQTVSLLNPASPTLIGLYTSSTTTYGMAVAGERLYVANGSAGLLVLDVSPPSSLTYVGSYDTPGSAIDVAVAGDLAFVADRGAGLQILDIRNPTPVFVGSWDSPGDAWGIAVEGDHAYLGDAAPGVHVIDISDPASPALLGTCNTPSSARGLVASGDLVCVADYGFVHTIDVSDPSAPVLAGTYDTPGIASNVALDGEHLFVADGAAGGLQVVKLRQTCTTIRAASALWPADFLAPFGDILFAGSPSGLRIWDITNVAGPLLVANLPQYTPVDLTPAGDLAYAVGPDGLEVLQVTNPAAPVKIGGSFLVFEPAAVAVQGDLAYVVDESESAPLDLSIFDVTTPSAPMRIGGCNMSTPATRGPTDVEVAGGWAYVAARWAGAYSDGLQVVNVGNPTTPYVVAVRDAGTPSQLALSGNQLLLAGGALWIYDVSTPTNPVLRWTGSVGGITVRAVAVSGDVAFCADGAFPGGQIRVVDISDPGAPQVLAGPSGPRSTDLRLAGDLLFAGHSTETPYILQVFERELDLGNNRGQSGTFAVTAEDVRLARIVQVGSSTPERCWLSADDGLNWQVMHWSQFEPLDYPGRRLRWRCDLDYDSFGVPPELDELRIDWSYATDVEPLSGATAGFALWPVAPNPFVGEATIRFALPRAETVVLRVHDVAGRRVATLARREFGPGVIEVRWGGRDEDGRRVASGTYFVRLRAGEWEAARKLVLSD